MIHQGNTSSKIPEGWISKTLDEVADVLNGYAFKSAEL